MYGCFLKEGVFWTGNHNATDSTEFIFHFDRLKDAIKKQSNLLVQRGREKQKLFLN